LTITGFNPYTPDADNPIWIQVNGVVNPNLDITTNTGQFIIALLTQNTQNYIDCNPQSGALIIATAPGWSTLFDVSASNRYTRLPANYIFNFTASIALPPASLLGYIIVEFPSQFDLVDGSSVCTTTDTTFATSLTCYIAKNKVFISGNTAAFTGNTIFTIKNIINPIDPGTADNIILKTYDGFNKKVLERSFNNLDPFIFSYTYPGPLISVNNDNPIRVQIGTQSSAIPITLDYPCALNLTFVPTTPGFSINPLQIPLTLGQI
jgi:hypothetical protein